MEYSSMHGHAIYPQSGRVVAIGDDSSSFRAGTPSTHSSHESSTDPTSHNAESPKCSVIFTQEVDPVLLKTSLEDRVAYLTDFLNFTAHDAEVIRQIAPAVNDVIPGLVDDLYSKLFEFDITKKVFMARNQGFEGPLPAKLEDLTLDSAQIQFRKVFMKVWARKVLTSDYTNGKTWAYMDKVGIMHTGVSPFKHQRTMGIAPLNVPYRDCALALGLVQTLLQSAILQLPDRTATMSTKIEAVAAITKVIWIQNDLFSRHYINE
ncbi:uncharacterized protein PHACADRAFT_249564 [Phanerochaete carnosa HHB-10118-sp]|uniref:Globin-sensor domain-containing protein n=1 Tax=Phanerochaete carnosa (strain HHB-10118-sp) TaxID=650164 RepID=K5WJE1_PHACS|nr:uncharacterized protein PHACADRAFT_249564 [Phanerochaete carnosa HHB-10118-sp]EKM59249.1 hypothetical protein PHACADRAFT_249564 [Phanerochaete carnosa HHB-10118-sp]